MAFGAWIRHCKRTEPRLAVSVQRRCFKCSKTTNKQIGPLRSILDKFSELVFMTVFRLQFRLTSISKWHSIKHSASQLNSKKSFPWQQRYKVSIVAWLQKIIGCFFWFERKSWVFIRLIEKLSHTNYFPSYKPCPLHVSHRIGASEAYMKSGIQ